MRGTTAPARVLLPVLLVLGCSVAEFGLPEAGGGLPVTVFVPAGVTPADVGIALDGEDVRALFSEGAAGPHRDASAPGPGLA